MYLLKPDLLFEKKLSSLFTFHYVSIKTHQHLSQIPPEEKFTFHYVSIKTIMMVNTYILRLYLHSTMYLLKRRKKRQHGGA